MWDCAGTCKAQATSTAAMAYLELLRGELRHCQINADTVAAIAFRGQWMQLPTHCVRPSHLIAHSAQQMLPCKKSTPLKQCQSSDQYLPQRNKTFPDTANTVGLLMAQVSTIHSNGRHRGRLERALPVCCCMRSYLCCQSTLTSTSVWLGTAALVYTATAPFLSLCTSMMSACGER